MIFLTDSGDSDTMGINDRESQLFESIEFCLALLGTIPVPVCVADEENRLVILSAGKFCDGLHLKESCDINAIMAQIQKSKVFSSTLEAARKSDRREVSKGACSVKSDGYQRDMVIVVNATPVRVKDKRLFILTIEDLTEIEQLKGLLPICMKCNKIRDGHSGEWIRIEQYISEHSPAKFSHGLCPECATEFIKDIES